MRGIDPISRADFQTLSAARIREAEALLAGELYAGAYDLTGCAVECVLKACLCRQCNQHYFPPRPEVVRDMYSHDLSRLVALADLTPDLEAESRRDRTFAACWTAVKDWTEQSRYALPQHTDAQQLYLAAADPSHGVLQSLHRHW